MSAVNGSVPAHSPNPMKITEWLHALLVRWGLVFPRVAPPTPKPRKRAKRKAKTVSHAESVKAELLDAVTYALSRAPGELDPATPKATIAVNGSLYTVVNTVDALSEFQSRLMKLKTTPGKAPGVPKACLKFRVHQ